MSGWYYTYTQRFLSCACAASIPVIFFLAQLAYDAGQHIGLIGSATPGATHSVDRRKQGARRGVLQPVTGIQHVTDEIYTETGPETGGVSPWIRWTN